MCPSGSYITLGIFLKLFLLMEDECHKLDHKMFIPESDCGESYKQYCSDMTTKLEVMEQLHTVKESIDMLETILFHHFLTNKELAYGYTVVIEDICLDISEMKAREEELVST